MVLVTLHIQRPLVERGLCVDLVFLCSCFYPWPYNENQSLLFQGYANSKAVTLEASFTPDSQFIMIGELISFSSLFLCTMYLFVLSSKVKNAVQ